MEVLCQHKDQKPHFAGLCESCCQEFIKLSGGIHGGADPPTFQIAERERLVEASSEKVTDSSCILKPHRHESSDEHISEVEQTAKEAAAAAAAAFKDLSGASDEMRSAQELAAATNAAVAKSREERRKKRASENGNPAQTAAEATRQMLTKKGLSSKINYDVLDKLFDDQPVHDAKRTRIELPHASDIDVQQQFSKERNGAYTDYDGDEKEENGDVEEMGGEVPYTDEWYSRNVEEVDDYGYYDNDGDYEY